MRNRALVRAAREYIEGERLKGRTPTITETAEAVVDRPAPSYFISFTPLYNGVCHILGSSGAVKPTTLSRQRLMDVAERVVKLRQNHANLSLAMAVTMVMAEGGAPRFYITPSSAKQILARELVMPRQFNF